MTENQKLTHEAFIEQIANHAAKKAPQKLHYKLSYGAGEPGTRGVTYYKAWKNGEPEPIPFVEICATTEESPTQLAGTTIHELAHVLVGYGHGHDKTWKEACETLGLRAAKAAGTQYTTAHFTDVDLRSFVSTVKLTDGKPVFPGSTLPGGLTFTPPQSVKPCKAGWGTRGGKSRGVGSGSRLRKYVCDGCGQIVRASTDTLTAQHNHEDGKTCGLFKIA